MEDEDLKQELFEWYASSVVPTCALPHQVRPEDFANSAPVALSALLSGIPQSQISHARKKLALVLDLDMTLVHALQESSFTEKFESSLLGFVDFTPATAVATDLVPDDPQIFKLLLDDVPYILKLRPGIRTFLREIAPFYELNIFTKATRPYLHFLMTSLDPDRQIFATSISRDDAPDLDLDTKVLNLVSERPLSEVIIFDDRQSVWRDCPDNVIRAEPYIFLEKKMGSLAAAINNQTFVCEDPDRQLLYIANVLKQVHLEYSRSRGKLDVREILKNIRQKTLQGCLLMFSGVPKDELPALQQIVAQYGGQVSQEEDDLTGEGEPRITHLLVNGGGKFNTKKVYDAKRYQGKVKVVHGSWLNLACSTWTKPKEELFDLSLFSYDAEGRIAVDIDPWEHIHSKP